MQSFYGHSLLPSLLTPGGVVIDVGARAMDFSREMLARGMRVIALDADPLIAIPEDLVGRDGFTYLNRAVVPERASRVQFALHDSLIARYVVTSDMPQGPWRAVSVPAMTILEVIAVSGVCPVEAVKLDCEGSEYGILQKWPGPVAKQITVEFHEHCGKRSEETYGQILSHIGQWYDTVQHQITVDPNCEPNYWDSLFVLRS